MHIIDEQGRLFGRINLIDFLVLLLIFVIGPYFIYRAHRLMVAIPRTEVPVVTMKKAEYEAEKAKEEKEFKQLFEEYNNLSKEYNQLFEEYNNLQNKISNFLIDEYVYEHKKTRRYFE